MINDNRITESKLEEWFDKLTLANINVMRRQLGLTGSGLNLRRQFLAGLRRQAAEGFFLRMNGKEGWPIVHLEEEESTLDRLAQRANEALRTLSGQAANVWNRFVDFMRGLVGSFQAPSQRQRPQAQDQPQQDPQPVPAGAEQSYADSLFVKAGKFHFYGTLIGVVVFLSVCLIGSCLVCYLSVFLQDIPVK